MYTNTYFNTNLGRTYQPLFVYYLPQNYYAVWYSPLYKITYYDGYGYNFYYGAYGYYEFSVHSSRSGSMGSIIGTIVGLIVLIAIIIILCRVCNCQVSEVEVYEDPYEEEVITTTTVVEEYNAPQYEAPPSYMQGPPPPYPPQGPPPAYPPGGYPQM